ncbi:hypothetical protein GGS26DRAFT_594052 [Hypomontagnella submonticulosa]|nr:hypothetical protein GGS26DRAFT_594052 [Hypomontagnella submonticulosa]
MATTLLPFLYHTRTILRANPQTTFAFVRSLHATHPKLRGQDDIPFVSAASEDDVPSEPTRRGTITPSERQIFERIFADIKARGLKPTLKDDPPTNKATRSTLQIIQQAADDAASQKPRPATIATPSFIEGARQDRERALLRFPPELRAAAGRALGAIQTSPSPSAPVLPNGDDIAYDEASIAAGQGDDYVDEGWKEPVPNINRTIELEAKRHPERHRVEQRLAKADTDIQLWDVMLEEVFTMPLRLGIDGDVPEPEDRKQGKKKKKTKKEKKEEPLFREGWSDTPLSLYVHGPLYPAYLLLALRRFNTAFRAPSPFAFRVLPRVKELGLQSYVLGVSTPFYNELLTAYWTRGDLPGMMALLEEMRHTGLSFDKQTAAIVGEVDSALSVLATREASGSFARAVMTMPEYDRSMRERIRVWSSTVESSIVE